jgi:hypothetical protein
VSVISDRTVVANVGVELFADELDGQGVPVERVQWRPPEPAAEDALARLATTAYRTATANDSAIERLNEAHPLLTGVGIARDVIEMERNVFLHAGPPIEWYDMSGPLRGAIQGAAVYEGLAADPDDAAAKAAAGAFEFEPCHERGVVGPMAGVVSSSMPVWIVTNVARSNRAFATFNEGLGKVLRYGAFDGDVIDRLRWIERVLARVMTATLEAVADPIDLRAMIAQALQMGDEGHNRNRAGTSLFLRSLLPQLVVLDEPSDDVASSVDFISGNDHFFLNLVMAAAKSTADAAAGIDGSSVVVAMARNGTEFGIRTSGTGDRWFTGPAGIVDGLYLPGFGPEDANPDIGDSTITETIGVGGCAMAAAPAIVRFVGGTAADALATTATMYEIAWGASDHYKVPALEFRGTPLGFDARAVVSTGILPAINTGIAHRQPGVGQVGAGLVKPPMEAFVEAVRGLGDGL